MLRSGLALLGTRFATKSALHRLASVRSHSTRPGPDAPLLGVRGDDHHQGSHLVRPPEDLDGVPSQDAVAV